MLLTLVSAGIALAGGISCSTFGTRFAEFPSFAPTLGVMLGLGAGIDYALLIVGRYREQLAAGDDVRRAARRQRDRRHVGDRGGGDRRRGDRRAARDRHPLRRADGPRLRDHGRRRRGRRRHRPPGADGRVREAAAPPQARARRAVGGLRPLGPPDRRPARGSPPAWARSSCSCSPRRSRAAPRAARRRQRRARQRRAPRPTTRSPRASAPASTARSCSRRSCPRAAAARRWSACSARSPPTRASPPPRRRSATTPATPPRSP